MTTITRRKRIRKEAWGVLNGVGHLVHCGIDGFHGSVAAIFNTRRQAQAWRRSYGAVGCRSGNVIRVTITESE